MKNKNGNHTVTIELTNAELLAIMDFVDAYTDKSVIEEELNGVPADKAEEALDYFYVREALLEGVGFWCNQEEYEDKYD